MSIEQYNPFWVPFWKIRVDDWLNKKNQLLDLVDWDNEKGKTEKHFTDYHLNLNYVEPFTNIIIDELKNFSMSIQFNIQIRRLWAQRYTGSHNMMPHTHGNEGFSAVLYAEFNPKVHNATTFHCPFKNFVDGFDITHIPEVEEGDILIFPSAIIHYAEPSNSDEHRTIFSWNMDVQYDGK